MPTNDRQWDQHITRVQSQGGYIDIAVAVQVAALLNSTYHLGLCVISNAHYAPETKRRYFLAHAHNLTNDTPPTSVVWK